MYKDGAYNRQNQNGDDDITYVEMFARKVCVLWKKRSPTLKRPIFEYLFVAVVLLIITMVLTGGVIFNPSTRLFTDGIGDATSGFGWVLFAQRHLPLFTQYSHLINYPYGENLLNLTYVTWSVVYAPLYVLALMFSALAALNIMTLVGFVTCGLAMYILIKRLTNKWYLASVAAYGAAFMPYHMINSTAHLTNIFSWVFVATIGAFVAFLKKQTIRRGILLSVIIAAAAYTDGYFVLIESVLLFALVIAMLVTGLLLRTSARALFNQLKGLCLVAIGAIILLAPVAVVELSSGNQIQQGLSNVRGNILTEVKSYAVRPIDLLLPGQGNVLVGNSGWYQHYFGVKNSHSNNVENTNYIGYTILILYALAVVYSIGIVWRGMRSPKKAHTKTDQAMMICTVAVPLVLIWMLPPELYNIKMPFGYLVEYTAFWRVPARIFLAMQPLMLIAGTLALNKFIEKKHYRLNVNIMIVAIWFFLLALEYNVNVYRPAFGFENMPQAYAWLAKQKGINAVAEVPIVDQPTEITGYYIFAQMISGKPIVNDQLSPLPPGLYNALGDLSNPETINFIRSRHIDTIIDHTDKCEAYSWGQLIYQENNALAPPSMDEAGSTICIYHLNPAPVPTPYFAYANSGFQSIDFRDTSERWWLILNNNHPSIRVVNSRGQYITNPSARARFTSELSFVGNAPMKQLNWVISQDGKVVSRGSGIRSTTMSATISASEPIDIQVTTDSWYRVPNPGETDMRQVDVTKVQ